VNGFWGKGTTWFFLEFVEEPGRNNLPLSSFPQTGAGCAKSEAKALTIEHRAVNRLTMAWTFHHSGLIIAASIFSS